ncbi:hypothetical protein CP960_00305 [Malaciobacter halophilus]|uniref:Uncharacterized protein n=1 Tax=Malaciobacter halophilus TaxID=197482 RepID=A0A2N1J6P0_9BACT|nr:hypothetical protein [Malaciobacter halophilus]AXH10015.1 FlaG family protein [Malaciobacter halophilus]PKI82230.1 hypothetical protein CP960_00305 [Malaciobacter halophilus]
MEYGLIPKLESYSNEQSVQIQKVQPSNATSQVIEGKESSKVKEEFTKLEETKETKKVSDANISSFVEYKLTNLDFGYNSNSKDFYVKVNRGDFESQYPTDEMMRLKAYFLKVQQQEAAEAF